MLCWITNDSTDRAKSVLLQLYLSSSFSIPPLLSQCSSFLFPICLFVIMVIFALLCITFVFLLHAMCFFCLFRSFFFFNLLAHLHRCGSSVPFYKINEELRSGAESGTGRFSLETSRGTSTRSSSSFFFFILFHRVYRCLAGVFRIAAFLSFLLRFL